MKYESIKNPHAAGLVHELQEVIDRDEEVCGFITVADSFR